MNGVDKDFVKVHAPKGDARYEEMTDWLNRIFRVKREYDVSADKLVWIQIGPGFPWKNELGHATIGIPSR